LDRELLMRLSKGKYFIDTDRDVSREFRNGINRLWAEGIDASLLRELKSLVISLYPEKGAVTRERRQEIIENKVKMIYIHPHMDEDNFDVDRVSRCGDLVPDESGRMIPACSYNLIYRRQDPRFWVEK